MMSLINNYYLQKFIKEFIFLQLIKRKKIMSKNSWVVIANSEHARIFVNDSSNEKALHLLEEYSQKDLHKKDSDLIVGEQKEHGADSKVESSDPKYLLSNKFANALAKKLEHSRTDHSFEKLLLVCPPGFLGLMKEHLSKEIHKFLVTLEKDYSHDNVEKLIQHLGDHL
jgi:protein required for attachment to host cells